MPNRHKTGVACARSPSSTHPTRSPSSTHLISCLLLVSLLTSAPSTPTGLQNALTGARNALRRGRQRSGNALTSGKRSYHLNPHALAAPSTGPVSFYKPNLISTCPMSITHARYQLHTPVAESGTAVWTREVVHLLSTRKHLLHLNNLSSPTCTCCT